MVSYASVRARPVLSLHVRVENRHPLVVVFEQKCTNAFASNGISFPQSPPRSRVTKGLKPLVYQSPSTVPMHVGDEAAGRTSEVREVERNETWTKGLAKHTFMEAEPDLAAQQQVHRHAKSLHAFGKAFYALLPTPGEGEPVQVPRENKEVLPDPHARSRACAKSAIRSSASSIPTEYRTRLSRIPICNRSSVVSS